ncbi:JNK1/MAPK8-associated membrane protein [Acropora cervicornis]|uniref:JNK1/MAPK8-associated membrane protein n=1 Tax=Acropora cervicornis TaxID=6130 RepID=A0AAD9V0A9_ACRCE|nr:JNK1/MAPK8-associated membrane protein [Acropora cervicornis]
MSLLSKEPLIVVWILIMFQKGSNGALDPCSGKYCGRIINNNGHFGDCGACPRGYRTNGSVCLECLSSPELYDWLYLGFMASLPVIIHWFFIDFFIKRERKRMYLLFLSAFVESALAAIFTLLASKPQGSLNLISCKSEHLADWYTIFFNPKPDHVNIIHCTQEAVYPLYTIVLMYYAVCVGLLTLVRPIISHQFCDGQGRASIYAALRHVIIIVAHWLVHAYGILAVTLLRNPAVHGPLFSLVLSPVLFYLVTHSFTEPNKFKT